MRKSYLLTVAVLLVGCALVTATEIPLVNPSFEDPGFDKIKGWNGEGIAGTLPIDIPGWQSDGPVVDSGVESNTSYAATDGDWTAFTMSGDPAFYQRTSFTITGGEIITLAVDIRNTWAAKTAKMTLYANDVNNVRVPLAIQDVNVTDTYTTFTLVYNTGSSSVGIGKKLGVEFANSSSGKSWIGLDNVRLSYVLAVSAPPAGSLTHSYTFDDGTARDVVGDANGVLVGGAKVEGGALVTSAQGDYMSMPGDKIAMNTYPQVTIEAWYTPVKNGNTGWSMLGYFGDSVNGLGSNGFFMTSARGDNVSRAAISIGDVATPWASESGANGTELDDGILHHMVATIDGNNISLFIDGVLSATTPLSARNQISGISQNFAMLAKGGYSGDPTWIGQIWEFNIYNKALSVGQVMYLFGVRGNMTHQYTFSDGTKDSVGAADGVLVGGAEVKDGALLTTVQDQWMEMDGNSIAVNTYPEVTIECWYTPKAGGNTGWSMLAYFGDSVNGLGSNGFFITTARGDNVSRAAISCGDVATPWASESGVNGVEYDDGLLHQMVSTINATDITLWIDGVFIGKTPLSATNKLSLVSNKLAYLAKGGYSGDPEWIGQIHEFRTYNKALVNHQVAALFVQGPK
jgi:hypothetical protein